MGGTTNYSGYSNPRLDYVLRNGLKAIQPVDRAVNYRVAQQILLADRPAIFLYDSVYHAAYSTSLKGAAAPQRPARRRVRAVPVARLSLIAPRKGRGPLSIEPWNASGSSMAWLARWPEKCYGRTVMDDDHQGWLG